MNQIIRLMQLRKYNVSDKGICAGIAQMWLQAWLAGEQAEEEFFERIAYLHSKPIQEIEKEIQCAQKKLKKKQPITIHERKMLEILAFFDGILLYQTPTEFPNFFIDKKNPSQHDLEEISKVTSSPKLEKNGNIAQVLNLPIMYNREELQTFFDQLKEIIKSHHPEPIALSLSSGQHRIGIRYDVANDKWLIADQTTLGNILNLNHNDSLSKAIDNLKYEHEEIARYVVGALALEDIVFNMKILTTNNIDNSNLKEKLSHIRTTIFSTLTKEQANKNNAGINLAHIAVLNGHIDFMKKYLEFGLDINAQTVERKLTPLHYAAGNNKIEIVKLLLEQNNVEKANINATDTTGLTPSNIAAQNKSTDIVKLLAKHNADFTITDNEGNSPLSYAFAMKNWDMIFTMLATINTPKMISSICFYKLLKNINRNEFYAQFLKYASSLQGDEKNTILKNVLQNKNAIGLILKSNVKMKHHIKLFTPFETNFLSKLSHEFPNVASDVRSQNIQLLSIQNAQNSNMN